MKGARVGRQRAACVSLTHSPFSEEAFTILNVPRAGVEERPRRHSDNLHMAYFARLALRQASLHLRLVVQWSLESPVPTCAERFAESTECYDQVLERPRLSSSPARFSYLVGKSMASLARLRQVRVSMSESNRPERRCVAAM